LNWLSTSLLPAIRGSIRNRPLWAVEISEGIAERCLIYAQ
jgi:hypothetical protein